MKEKMKYSIEYFEVAHAAYKNGFTTKKVERIVNEKFLDEAKKRSQQENEIDDKFTRADKTLYSAMKNIIDYKERLKIYMEKLGLEGNPYKILYESKEEYDSDIYLDVTIVYPDDRWTCEELRYPGCKTREDFLNHFERLNKSFDEERYPSPKITEDHGPYDDGPYTIYIYKGMRYKEQNKRG